MSPSGVRIKVVHDRLAAVAEYTAALKTLPLASLEEFLADRRNPDSAESLLRRSLEALFDIARHLLAKGHGHGALEYREIARLCGEHNLLTDPELVHRFRQMAGFRNRLVHFYEEVTPEELYGVVTQDLGDVEAVAAALRRAAAELAERAPGRG